MNILHLCLSCFYIDGYAYQENQLVSEHIKLGHDVNVLASTETFDSEGKLTYTLPGKYMGSDGACVTRLPYSFGFFPYFARKLRKYIGLKKHLRSINPDVIIFHGLCAYDLLTVRNYCIANPHVIFYADSHEDFNNSARSFFSKWMLHYLFYRSILRLSINQIQSVLCVSQDILNFVHSFYGVSKEKLEFFPLGGNPVAPEEYHSIRNEVRREMNWSDSDIILIQSGKIDSAKRLDWTLDAFYKSNSHRLKLVIAGILMDDVREHLLPVINSNSNIQYLGWVNAERLRNLLIAADVYVQPGSQSATMQMAMCCHRPVVLDNVISHVALFDGNGVLISNSCDLLHFFNRLSVMSTGELEFMSIKSLQIASALLDYRKQALRLLVKNNSLGEVHNEQ